ncbi:mandelate racemase/muconate lactonizing enzyme family protein [Oceaniovalibus sp. ACAM 378]|uniref:mandelate racemase/muconate lactonizing enzyme family protein n=1 Tax=Oceaniovalibus sp. ACAM 378 TaxID=2599923 RepID=UPI0011D44CF2|nr:mandelate racemase/muconate lactonizing enzyme family protein [Oceaniovalibus sp. ACAM 378]TYB83601.1 mandelate racemase/muconate lactonizing enzyme family protein [Oceaniovalibus sp. ACAM 378]
MKIQTIEAFPISFPIPEGNSVTLGIGRSVKRDAVLVKITTDEGVVGWGESHHGRAPGAVAHLIRSTLSDLIVGMDALANVTVWDRIYKMQLASHGMGAAAAIAMSGIDMALWDIRGKAANMPLYRLLGGEGTPVTAYAGGIALGYQAPETLAEEAAELVGRGYRALKLRIGDTPAADIARIRAVRDALGAEVDILTDANANASFDHVRRIMPVLDDVHAGWLEEPFSPHDYPLYERAAQLGTTPLAAGENHYTRFEFRDLITSGTVGILQPDLSKTGGITEGLRIAAMGSAYGLEIHPHTSTTALNMAATIHFLAAIDMPGYYEAEVSKANPFRDEISDQKFTIDSNGCFHPFQGPGLGLEIDEDFVKHHPLIDGPGYVK